MSNESSLPAPPRDREEAERMALALFPGGLRHWIMHRALPMVARDDGAFWEFDYGDHVFDDSDEVEEGI